MDFRQAIIDLATAQGVADAATLIEVPPDSNLGDYALPCFQLARVERKAPAQIAAELAPKLEADFLERVVATGPYVNFFVAPRARATGVLAEVMREEYGRQRARDARVMVEYSQPNTHKAFHVGHLRGTSLGEALARILRYAGFTVVQTNYSGDTGAHIGKWLWYYTTHDVGNPPAERFERERWIADVYVRAVKALDENPEAQAQADAMVKAIEAREPGALLDAYAATREQSIDAFRAIYEELHAHFDYWFFESEVEDRGKAISRELLERGIAREDDGALVVDLEDEKLGIWVLVRRDGTALYSAKDLALAEAKFNKYHIDTSIYVVGAAQSLHFRQLFATLARMGFPQTDRCHHLSYAEVRLPSGKMSSRSGENILYSGIKREVERYATEQVRLRHADWSDEQVNEVVRQVTVGALKWDMLAVNPNKTIVFDAAKATEFEGETGPYLQYTHARACGILDKADFAPGDGASLVEPSEHDVLRLLAAFPEAVERAARDYHPGFVAHYCMDLAQAFNRFYHDCPVLSASDPLRRDRLALVAAVARVLGRGLELLAIDAPRNM
ncbi:MAG: arginine--tRNA ligase [Gammaproteobacteria bacterium]|nr:arginine--tRNA ligase [Gammaproteobacteria bacterium]